MSRTLVSILPVWVAVAVAAGLAMALASPGEFMQWAPVLLSGGLLLSFAIQLVLTGKQGLVTRLMVTASGSILILAAATGVALLLAH